MKPYLSPSPLVAVQLTALVCLLALLAFLHRGVPQMINYGIAPIYSPATTAPPVVDERPTDIVLRLSSDGLRYIGFRWVPDADFNSTVTRLHTLDPSARFLLRADARSSFRSVRRLIADLRLAGVTRIILVAERRTDATGSARTQP